MEEKRGQEEQSYPSDSISTEETDDSEELYTDDTGGVETSTEETDTEHTQDEPLENVVILENGPEVHLELIGEGAWNAATPSTGRLILSGEHTTLHDIRWSSYETLEWIDGMINSATEIDGWLLLSIGADLWVWEQELWESPLEDHFSQNITRMEVDYWGDLWMMSDKLYRYQDGNLQSFAVEGEEIAGLWAVDGMIGNWHVTWVEIANVIAGIDVYGDIREQVAWTDVRQIVTDHDGNTWVNDGGNIRLRKPEQNWVTVLVPELCTTIMGHTKTRTLWFSCLDPGPDEEYLSEDDIKIFYRGSAAEGIAPVVPPEGEWLDVDPSGRLLIRTDEGIARLSGEPWLQILGLPENLNSNAQLNMHPSRELEVESMSIHVGLNAEPVDLGAVPPWEISLSPLDYTEDDLNNGALEIDVTVTWLDGTSATAAATIQVIESVATWDDNIQPMHATYCELCHGSAAATQLDAKQDWVDNIDNIIFQVTSEIMPLGGPALSADQTDLIQSWKDNGFQ